MKIEGLFPKPIGFTKLESGLSEESLKFCRDIKNSTVQNNGNLTSKDRYILNKPELSELKIFLEEKVDEYFKGVFATNSNVSLGITQSWLNYTDEGQYHHKHHHNNSFISGVFYIDTEETDKITFYDDIWEPFSVPTEEYNIFNSLSWWVPAEKNSLLLFPSSLVHGVEGLIDNHTRISLAFNTFFKGTIGNYDYATELKL